MSRLPAWLRRAALGTRLTIVTLVVLALAQPLWGHTSEAMTVVFAVDKSESLSADAFVNQALSQLNDKRRAGVIDFGRDAAVERPIDAVGGQSQGVAVRADGTNIAEALHLARSM